MLKSSVPKTQPTPGIPGSGTRFPTPRGQLKTTVKSGSTPVGRKGSGDLRSQAYKRMRSVGSI